MVWLVATWNINLPAFLPVTIYKFLLLCNSTLFHYGSLYIHIFVLFNFQNIFKHGSAVVILTQLQISLVIIVYLFELAFHGTSIYILLKNSINLISALYMMLLVKNYPFRRQFSCLFLLLLTGLLFNNFSLCVFVMNSMLRM